MNYDQFLSTKQRQRQLSGFESEDLNPHLFPFQDFIVRRALKAGKYAIFADCGLGKTLMQLEWAHQVSIKTHRPVLVLCPLAVSGQTIAEGKRFGIEVGGYGEDKPIQVINYDQIDNIDPALFSGVVLDESSILKNFQGKIKTAIVDAFRDTPYKLACTATPSPNDPMEIGNHSEFLDVMPRSQMLSMFFVHDGGNTSSWRIKGHAEDDFYLWIGSWAIMLSKPADIGFDQDGYALPRLNFIERQIKTPKRSNGSLFNDIAVSATNFNKELRITLLPRIEDAAKIINEASQPFIAWVKQNEEGDKLQSLVPGSVQVKGSDSRAVKESRLLGFGRGEYNVLITKAKIAQFGLNYQNCSKQIFVALDFSFESLYQAIRRSYRFGQKRQVDIYIVTTDTMQNVIGSIEKKRRQFETMQQKMSHAIDRVLNDHAPLKSVRDMDTIQTDDYTISRGDCCRLIDGLDDESIHFSIFSPPFADLYTYSDHLEDMGNSADWQEFMQQFAFLVSGLYRVMKSGRNVAVHCMDLPIQKGKEGLIGLRDFSGLILRAFEDAGFIYHSRVTIWKDPVTEMQRTKALGLLHKQLKKDSTMSRVGIPDYLLVFRKDGERQEPVETDIPVDLWQKWASPVWMDINYSDTLQYRSARDEKDEKHICPLQLPTIERAIALYTNKGDTVLSPFAGIGSEGYQAIKMGRRFVGFELKESYFDQMQKNLAAAVASKLQKALF